VPPFVIHRLFRAADLETGMAELVSEGAAPEGSALIQTLALVPWRGVVEIPTLGWGGLALLSAALSVYGLRRLRMRSTDSLSAVGDARGKSSWICGRRG